MRLNLQGGRDTLSHNTTVDTVERRISVRPQIPMAASTQALIDAIDDGSPLFPLPPTSPVYDQAPLGHRVAMILESSAAAAARAPTTADRAEDVGYVRALQASKHRMLLDARTDRRDIRLEIDVVRGQRTAYETKFHEVCQAYHSSEAQNRALLARLETLETHMSRIECQRQSAEGHTIKQMMRTQVLKARALIDMVEDTSSSC
ncbi:hypothetical protein Tco_0033561 [Tanacetum coccineum]